MRKTINVSSLKLKYHMDDSEFIEDILKLLIISQNALGKDGFKIKVGNDTHLIDIEEHWVRKNSPNNRSLRPLYTRIKWTEEAKAIGVNNMEILKQCLKVLVIYSKQNARTKYYVRPNCAKVGRVIRVRLTSCMQ